MKRLLLLLLLSAVSASAEQATLAANTVLRTGESLVILKAGTVVQVVSRTDKTVSVKVGAKTGIISANALKAETFSDADMMSAPTVTTTATVPTSAPSPTPVAASVPPVSAAPKPHRPAQTMYGKAVEKAESAADSHEKALVSPTDEILGGK